MLSDSRIHLHPNFSSLKYSKSNGKQALLLIIDREPDHYGDVFLGEAKVGTSVILKNLVNELNALEAEKRPFLLTGFARNDFRQRIRNVIEDKYSNLAEQQEILDTFEHVPDSVGASDNRVFTFRKDSPT